MIHPTNSRSEAGWVVIVPVKRLELAKSRLGDTPPGRRRKLALAFALDTVGAAQACVGVAAVVVVTDDPHVRREVLDMGSDTIGDQPNAGLNPALAHAAREIRTLTADVGLVAVSADLPSLRTDELDAFLDAVDREGPGRYFVRDVSGTGTTVLAATSGLPLSPAFGGRSAARHVRSGALHPVLTPASTATLRRDVDTDVDLWDAIRLGVGRHTSHALALGRASKIDGPTPYGGRAVDPACRCVV